MSTGHDADTLELASQLLSFSPARVEWNNTRRGVPLPLSVETKTVQLERSRRQLVANRTLHQLQDAQSTDTLYANLRMYTKTDLKEKVFLNFEFGK